MVDAATVGLLAVGIIGLLISVIYLVVNQAQMKKVLGKLGAIMDSMRKERAAAGDIEQQKLLQREREQQWRELRDLAKGARWFFENLD
jgi:hypothetical protein